MRAKTWVTLFSYNRRFSAVMPWKVPSVIGERWRLIQTLLRGEKSLQRCCHLFGVSRKTAYKWRQRFLQDGRRGLRDQSRRPQRMPRRLGPKWIQRIKRWRKKRPQWGPKKLRAQFLRQTGQAPGLRTIARPLPAPPLHQNNQSVTYVLASNCHPCVGTVPTSILSPFGGERRNAVMPRV